jgi:hypothetical protein
MLYATRINCQLQLVQRILTARPGLACGTIKTCDQCSPRPAPTNTCGTNFLSHIRTQSLPHATLRNFSAQSGLEVTVMATKEQTRLERDITIIEQTLRAMIEIDPATIQILSEDSQQSRVGATLL